LIFYHTGGTGNSHASSGKQVKLGIS